MSESDVSMSFMVETKMKTGDIIRLRSDIVQEGWHTDMFRPHIVRRVEKKNDWVFVFGHTGPLSMHIMEVISESRKQEVARV